MNLKKTLLYNAYENPLKTQTLWGFKNDIKTSKYKSIFMEH